MANYFDCCELKERFSDSLLSCSLDTTYPSVVGDVVADFAGRGIEFTADQVRAAWVRGAAYAIGEHVANYYETPEGERRGDSRPEAFMNFSRLFVINEV